MNGQLPLPEQHPDSDLLGWQFDAPSGRAEVVALYGQRLSGFVRVRIERPDGSSFDAAMLAEPIRQARGVALSRRGVTP